MSFLKRRKWFREKRMRAMRLVIAEGKSVQEAAEIVGWTTQMVRVFFYAEGGMPLLKDIGDNRTAKQVGVTLT